MTSTRTPTRGPARALRAGFLAGASLLLATGAHLLGGGSLPAPGVLAVTAFLVGLVALTLTARRCRFAVLLGVLALEQAALHVTFTVASGVGAGCAPGTTPALHHLVRGALASCLPSAATGADTMAMPGWGMWAAHAVAVALTAALLARGEAWCWRAVDRLVRVATVSLRRRVRALRRLVVARPAVVPGVRPHSPAAPRGPPRTCGV